MRLLLDAHALLWWLQDDPRLSLNARESVLDQGSDVLVSAATLWEIEVKAAAGRLELGGHDLSEALADEGFQELPIQASHAVRAARLPPHHGDPFDRMLVAQALSENLTLVSKDVALRHYGAPILW